MNLRLRLNFRAMLVLNLETKYNRVNFEQDLDPVTCSEC